MLAHLPSSTVAPCYRTMGSTSRSDDGYSRSLSTPDKTLAYSSRPPDEAQASRPSRSGKSTGQSQNNDQSTDVPPQQSLVAPPMQLPLSYSDYMMKRNTATQARSGPGPSSSGQVSHRVVVVLAFVILTSNAPGSVQLMRTDELLSRSPHCPRAPPTHLVDPPRKTFFPNLKVKQSSRPINTLGMKTEGSPSTRYIRVPQVPIQWHERTHLHPNPTIPPNPNTMSNHLPGILYQRSLRICQFSQEASRVKRPPFQKTFGMEMFAGMSSNPLYIHPGWSLHIHGDLSHIAPS